MVLVPRAALVELDGGVVASGRVDQAGDGLLEGVVERGPVGRLLEALAVRGEAGLGVVEQAGPDVLDSGGVVLEDVDPGGGGPLGALVEEDLGEGVGREAGRVDAGGRAGGVLAGVEADARRGLDLPGADVDGLAERGLGGGRQAGELEVGQDLAGQARTGRLTGGVHGRQDVGRVEAGGHTVLREFELLSSARPAGLVGQGVGRVEHDVGEFGGQADLPQAHDDFVQAGVDVRGRVEAGGGAGVGLVLQGCWLEPEP